MKYKKKPADKLIAWFMYGSLSTEERKQITFKEFWRSIW